MSYTPRNVLVTGGAGFIGANFIRCWLSQNCDVPNIINLDLLTYAGTLSHLKNLPNHHNYFFVQGDINDKELLISLLRQYNIDTIVHFAAESHVDRSICGPAAFVQTNIIGTFTLLEAVKSVWLYEKKWDEKHCRFHHISTDEVYGTLNQHQLPFTEKSTYQPNSPYSASKASSDYLARSYHHTYGLPITMSHCSNNYGPYQHSEKFIPTIIRSCLNKQPIPVYGNGSNIRDWIYVEDHCLGILSILKNGKNGETYNLGGNCEKNNLMLTKDICQLMDEIHPWKQPYETLIQFVKDRPGHDWRYAIDSSKTKNFLGWEPKENLISGLRKTIQFYIESSKERAPNLVIHME